MVCMSPVVTSGLIDKIAEDYDGEVIEWKKQLENSIEVIYNNYVMMLTD